MVEVWQLQQVWHGEWKSVAKELSLSRRREWDKWIVFIVVEEAPKP
ncbi:hypothetical protein [Enterovibrio norvegicus]|uniref:Uncharacterized protein n=1 Tax=Enterovibrio norvegicus TaxID=188144 RepID=A0ABV4L3T5_9GAMM|nr:hypothetical protein [Enterovibrio norvegicus]MCC4798815.1 hypothetical protein [Enterovibrio norvegicus]